MQHKKLEENNISTSEKFIFYIASFCFAYALYIATKYSGQVPLDIFSFRQTQTALTAFWLGKNGFSLAYETPVAGEPWSIPFEFPIYQYIVASLSKLTYLSLDVTGRLVSFLFLTLCLVPVRSITRQLNLSPLVFYIFAALLFSSPLYLYWGRTFMIETAAIFFGIAAIKYFIDIIQMKSLFKYSSLFLIFVVLGILQKATTGLPILAILGLIYFFISIENLISNSEKRDHLHIIILVKKVASAFVYFGLPLFIGIIWTLYTDQIKEMNSLGVSLTSSALSKWNWGSLNQRLASALYSEVIWKRIFEQNLAGIVGVVILVFALFSNANRITKLVIVSSILMGLVPLFLFTNLHIVHSYYQVSNLVFLIYAVAVSIGHVLGNYFKNKIILLVLTLIIVASNYFWFSKEFFVAVKAEFNKENSRDYAVSAILKREMPKDKYFVAFGNDWSSSFAYLSERKSFTVPGFLRDYKMLAVSPERLINESHLGGVVLCPWSGSPSINDLMLWSTNKRRWKIGETHGCFIALPEATIMERDKSIFRVECQGNLEYVGVSSGASGKTISVAGWTTISGEKGILPEKVYVTLGKKNGELLYFEALQVNRPDVNAYFNQLNESDSGFSRLINVDSLSGNYFLGVARLNQGGREACQFQKEVSINGDGINSNE